MAVLCNFFASSLDLTMPRTTAQPVEKVSAMGEFD